MAGAPLEDKENMAPASTNASARGGTTGPPGRVAKTQRVATEAYRHNTRILHFGEPVAEFFSVRADETERMLAIDELMASPTSPELWLRVLRAMPPGAKTYVRMRAFRRAISLMDATQYRNVPSFVHIWILNAKLQGSENGTREEFTKMATHSIGERVSMFYEEFAAFELKFGNLTKSDEILELGVRKLAYDEEERQQMQKRIITGRLASPASFPEIPPSPSSAVKREVFQTPYDSARVVPGTPAIKQEAPPTLLETPSVSGYSAIKREVLQATSREMYAPRGLSTPRNGAKTILPPPPTTTTPISVANPLPTGLSTVSKLSRNDGSSVMTTPSYAARPSAKSQSTTRKISLNSSRLRSLAHLGAPMRVVASANLNDSNSDDDEDDDMLISSSPKEKKTTPPQSAQAPARPAKKPSIGDLSYIKNWAPERLGGSAKPTQPAAPAPASSTATKAPPTQKQPRSTSTFVAGFGVDSRQHDRIQLPSPKRLQVDAGVPLVNRGVESSPLSVSSVSSTSSPPLISGDSKMVKDPFGSLTSKVMVDGLTYIKLEQIGSGGSSKVYRMLGPDLKIYALKKIKLKRLDEKSIEQYTNEIKLLERLQGNPHIIRLVAAEQDLQQRQINVVMEHGEIDLSDRLRDLKDGMDENFLRVIWMQMLQAVHAIHRERIIHGDLKPANFLFVNGALKLIDFGIAKAISNDTTNIERDSQVGTVNYMSPEAIQGNATPNGQRNPHGKMKVGRASDIWSLGCILYQVVYGKPPFADVHSIIEKFRCIIDPSVPIQFPPLTNKDLEDVIRSCLQRDHRARPPIDGERGLLQHPFLRSSSGGGDAASTVTLSNAPQVLSQLGDLLRTQGVDVSRVSTFLSIGQQGLRRANRNSLASPRIGYNTQERRTEI